MKNRPILKRVTFALAGLGAAWSRERSFRTQVWIAGLVGLALLWLRPSAIWWGLILLTIAVVFVAELFNAAIEALIDHLHPDIHSEIRIIKDMAAGAVLVASIIAVAIGVALVISSLFDS